MFFLLKNNVINLNNCFYITCDYKNYVIYVYFSKGYSDVLVVSYDYESEFEDDVKTLYDFLLGDK